MAQLSPKRLLQRNMALADLFEELFDAETLRQFLAERAGTPVVTRMPWGGSMTELALAAVRLLDEADLVTETLLDHLSKRFPERASDIDPVRELLDPNRPEAPEPGPTPGERRKSAFVYVLGGLIILVATVTVLFNRAERAPLTADGSDRTGGTDAPDDGPDLAGRPPLPAPPHTRCSVCPSEQVWAGLARFVPPEGVSLQDPSQDGPPAEGAVACSPLTATGTLTAGGPGVWTSCVGWEITTGDRKLASDLQQACATRDFVTADSNLADLADKAAVWHAWRLEQAGSVARDELIRLLRESCPR